MNFTYILVSNVYYFASEMLTFYGIAAVKEDGNRREIVDVAFDLSSDFEKVKRLSALCNEQKLDAIHLHNVEEDFINA